MAINLGSGNIRWNETRKIVKTTEGKLVLFRLNPAVNISYKTSSDDGDTWDGSWTVVTTENGDFDVLIDTDNHIYITYIYYSHPTTYLKFIKLTYNDISETWSAGSPVTISSTDISYGGYPAVMTQRSNGDLWVAVRSDADNTKIYTFYSTTGGSSWNSTSFNASTGPSYTYVILPKGSNIWVIYQHQYTLSYREYTSSWGSEINISTNEVNQGSHCIGAVAKVSDSSIYLPVSTKYIAAKKYIRVYHFDAKFYIHH